MPVSAEIDHSPGRTWHGVRVRSKETGFMLACAGVTVLKVGEDYRAFGILHYGTSTDVMTTIRRVPRWLGRRLYEHKRAA